MNKSLEDWWREFMAGKIGQVVPDELRPVLRRTFYSGMIAMYAHLREIDARCARPIGQAWDDILRIEDELDAEIALLGRIHQRRAQRGKAKPDGGIDG